MLPLRLEIENVNSFTDRQTVDFSAVTGDGIFCISGDTGAGKTTILDSVIIALFGMGTSGTGGERAGKDDFINVNAERAAVRFAFLWENKTYDVERAFTRKGAQTATLTCDGETVASGVKAVDDAVHALIGLEKEQFTQVIVLEQGKFSKFLNAKKPDRIRTVMKLFRLERFDLYSKVNRYYTDLERKLAVVSAAWQTYKEDTDSRVADMKRQIKALAAESAAAADETDRLRKALAAERDKATAYAGYLAAAARAETLKAAFVQATRALDAFGAEDVAALEQRAKDAAESARAAGARLDAVTAARDVLQEFSDVQKQLSDLREACLTFKRNAADAARLSAETAAQAETERAALEGHIRDLAAAGLTGSPADMRTAARLAYSEAKRAREEYGKRAAERDRLIREGADLQAQWDACMRGYADKKAAAEAATLAYDEARRTNAKAAATAGLKAGDPCPLCGGVLKEIPAATELTALKAAAERANEICRQADTLNATVNTKLEANAKRLAELGDIARPTADPAALERTVALADRAAETAERLAEWEKRAAKAKGDAERLQAQYDGKVNEGTVLKERCDSLQAAVVRVLGDVRSLAAYETLLADVRRAAQDAAGQAETLAARLKARETEERRLTAEKSRAEGVYQEALTAVKPVPAPDEAERERLERAIAQAEAAQKARDGQLGALQEAANGMTARVAEKRRLETEKKALDERFGVATQLLAVLKKNRAGDDLTAFVAEEYIREFTAGASARLQDLTGGKYSLEYADGDFVVRDFLNGNRARRSQTLSGGETFLASLALAAAISDMLAADRSYGFFFLDEGFGTLDEALIGSVSEALKNLSRDTLVGVVTHSAELIELIPAKIQVLAATDSSGSKIIL